MKGGGNDRWGGEPLPHFCPPIPFGPKRNLTALNSRPAVPGIHRSPGHLHAPPPPDPPPFPSAPPPQAPAPPPPLSTPRGEEEGRGGEGGRRTEVDGGVDEGLARGVDHSPLRHHLVQEPCGRPQGSDPTARRGSGWTWDHRGANITDNGAVTGRQLERTDGQEAAGQGAVPDVLWPPPTPPPPGRGLPGWGGEGAKEGRAHQWGGRRWCRGRPSGRRPRGRTPSSEGCPGSSPPPT